MTATKTKEFVFRIIRGRHQEGSGRENLKNYASHLRGEARRDKDGNDIPDIIETDLPLDELFGKEKFQRVEK